MNAQDDFEPQNSKTSSVEIERRLAHEEVCIRFEKGWTEDSLDQLPRLLDRVAQAQKSDLAYELFAIDLEIRQSRACEIQIRDYLDRVPGFSNEVSRAFEWSAAQCDESTQRQNSKLPEKIGDYRIVKQIGQGGAGVVYEAIQESLDRRVAIKMLTSPGVSSQLARFQMEARLVARLHHTNVIPVYGSGVHEGKPYFAMQLIEGQSLEQIIGIAQKEREAVGFPTEVHSAAKKFTIGFENQKRVATIGLEAAQAIGHAHEIGILHRDIKPANLMMDQDGKIWVGDFGVARLRDHDSGNTMVGTVVGTLRYLPSEAFSGKWNEQSDIYSLGVTLYELLALTPAFSRENHRQLVSEISQGRNVRPLRQIDGSVSKDLETIISKAMSFEPKQRFASATEFADELQRYLDGEPIKSRPISATERLWRWAKRKPSLAALLALTFAVAFIGLPIAMWLWLRASAALDVAEVSRREALASRYSNGALLVQNYIESGQVLEANRALQDLDSFRNEMVADQAVSENPWEIEYLNRSRDTSKFTLRGDPNLDVWHVAMDPQESRVATVHNLYPKEGGVFVGEVNIWNLQTGEKKLTLQDHGSRVYGCDFSSDGKLLATIGMKQLMELKINASSFQQSVKRGTLCIWDTTTGEQLRKIELEGEFDANLLRTYGVPILPCVKFSQDDSRIITSPGVIEVFDANTFESKWKCEGRHANELFEGEILVYSGRDIVGRDLETGQEIQKIEHQYSNYGPFSFSADRRKMVCRAKNEIQVWDSTESLKKHRDVNLPGAYWAIVSPDGSQLVYGTRGGALKIRSMNATTTDKSKLLGHQSTVTSGVFNRDGTTLVTTSRDKTARVWDLGQSKLTSSTFQTHDRVAAIGFLDKDNSVLFVARNSNLKKQKINAGTGDWAGEDGTRRNINTTYMAHWPRNDFSFSKSAKLLAAPDAEHERPDDVLGFAKHGRVNVWSTSGWAQRHTIETNLEEIHATTWSPCEQFLFVSGKSSSCVEVQAYFVNEEHTELVNTFSIDGQSKVTSLVFDKDFLAVGLENQAKIFGVERSGTGRNCKFSIDSHLVLEGCKNVASIDFSPDGKRMAVADFDNSKLCVFDVATGNRVYEQPGPRAFCCVKFSPCGTRLALSGFDGIVHFCDAEFGNRLLTLASSESLPGTNSINSKVLFSKDGKQIATNNWLGDISVWRSSD